MAKPLGTTTYLVTGITAAGCSATDTVTVTVNPAPTIGMGLTVTVTVSVALQPAAAMPVTK